MTTQQKQQFEKNYQYYLDNYDELVKLYDGKVLVIVNESISDACDDENDAYFLGVEKYGLGNFLLQPCSHKQKVYTIKTGVLIKTSSDEFSPSVI